MGSRGKKVDQNAVSQAAEGTEQGNINGAVIGVKIHAGFPEGEEHENGGRENFPAAFFAKNIDFYIELRYTKYIEVRYIAL